MFILLLFNEICLIMIETKNMKAKLSVVLNKTIFICFSI